MKKFFSFGIFGASLLLSTSSLVAAPEDLISNMETRLAYLEDQVRELTGQLEEVSHKLELAQEQGSPRRKKKEIEDSLEENKEPENFQDDLEESSSTKSSSKISSSMGEKDLTQQLGKTKKGAKSSLKVTPVEVDTEEEETPETQEDEASPPKKKKPETIETGDSLDAAETTHELPEDNVQLVYEHALSLLKQKEYKEAEDAFKEMIHQHPKDPLVINARYWLAESYYQRKQYKKASVAFAETYQTYRKHLKQKESQGKGKGSVSDTKASEALLKLALSLKALKQPKDACAALQELKSKFPKARPNVKNIAAKLNETLKCSASQKD